MSLHKLLAALAAFVLLASCGGGSRPSPQAAALQTAIQKAAERRQALAVNAAAPTPETAGVDPIDAANQLMDFAESVYPQHFPGHPPTGTYEGYFYRFYPTTGIYLGVRDGNVYLLGGPFGNEVRLVGALTQFISPTVPKRDPCLQAAATVGLHVTAAPALGKNAAAFVAACSGFVTSPQWRQTGGPTLPALAADKTQAISFDPPEAGTYTFQLSFVDPEGRARTEALALTVPAGAAPELRMTARASHAVRAGGKVSVRGWPTLAADETLQSITWSQLEGPTVTFDKDTEDDHLATFVAPAVPRDTLLRLRATLRTESGRTASDDVLVLVEHYPQAPSSDGDALWAGDHVSRVYPYRPNGPYAGSLVRCTYDPSQMGGGTRYNLCPLSQLSFVAQEAGNGIPTVEQVMDRVVVSHDWLGRNFEQFLRTKDERGDFRRMLRSVTAVVLGVHVRPSFYWAATGAIYLDADNFWLTPEERDTVNEQPDYRSEFGSDLKYETLWRYVQDSKNIFGSFDPRKRVTRTLDDLHNDAAWLMYHELGHALDALPPGDYPFLNSRRSAWANVAARYASSLLPSDRLSQLFPLSSGLLRELGDVNFRGATATAEQKATTPEQVAAAFAADRATDDYAYSTVREDATMTLEEFLMQHRLGIRRDFGIADQRAKGATSATIIVRWGQRGRVGEEAIKPRLRFLIGEMTPWVDLGEVDRLPAPLMMRAGESWRDNLQQPAPAALRRAPLAAPTAAELGQMRREFKRELRRVRHHQHPDAKRLPPVPLASQGR